MLECWEKIKKEKLIVIPFFHHSSWKCELMNSQEDMIRFAREAMGLSEPVPTEISPLQGRGSDRTFFRLRWNKKDSAILIHYDPKRVENTYYADIAKFLLRIGVAVPRMIRHDPARSLIVMEDLGDTTLWSLGNTTWETRRALYQNTLTIVHKLHSFPEKDFPSDRVKLTESFGPDLYGWEREYFRNHFVRDVCGIRPEPQFERELEAELSSLAERLLETIGCLVHRDLQSQNVMIRDGEPFLIDFQGMRFGSPFYDLGSLLCDPYVEFSRDQTMDLLLYYYSLTKQDLSWEDFQRMFWEASAQRLMQALGAYGFLGLKKGLKAYLEHIPSGLRNLLLATSRVSTLSRLRELSLKCQGAIEQKE
jgi:aminoglycoside/choline kinase family phosphotransferase